MLRWTYEMYGSEGLRDTAGLIQTVGPEDTMTVSHFGPSDAVLVKEHLDVVVSFQDASGHVWRREARGPVRRVRPWNWAPGVEWHGSDRLWVRLMRTRVVQNLLTSREM